MTHSFPTRRSSDLTRSGQGVGIRHASESSRLRLPGGRVLHHHHPGRGGGADRHETAGDALYAPSGRGGRLMWLEARHQRIQALIDRLDRVTTDQVIEELGVSRETVRRDFLELEAQGMLKRVHGGAVRIFDEPSIDKRIAIRVKYKQSIVRALAQRLNRELTVFLDAGRTPTLLAPPPIGTAPCRERGLPEGEDPG